MYNVATCNQCIGELQNELLKTLRLLLADQMTLGLPL